MDRPVEIPEQPAVKDDIKTFEMCDCRRAKNGRIHGYVMQFGKHLFPATIISLRAGKIVLEFLLEEKMVTPEEERILFEQMKASGLPAEVEVDIDVAVASAAQTVSPGSIALAFLMEEMSGRCL